MKKLIPALAMLLVAACLMGTSTYAWFSANEYVTASGMSVKAASDGGLAIASYVDWDAAPAPSDFASTATAKWSNAMKVDDKGTADTSDDVVTYAASIAPTSFDGADWWTAEAENANASAGKAGTYNEVIDSETVWDATTGAGIFQHTKWQIKSLAEGETLDLKINGVTVTGYNTLGTNVQLEKSLRVLVKCGGAYFKFAPLYSATSAEEQLYYTGSAAVQDTTLKFGNGTITAVTIGSVNSTTPTDVEVFVFFEGEDTNCKTNNIDIANLKNLSITINYTTA